MLTRLADRIESSDEDGQVVIRRFGMWGTNAEIECRKNGYFVVHPHGKGEEKFKTRADAEVRLKELIHVE